MKARGSVFQIMLGLLVLGTLVVVAGCGGSKQFKTETLNSAEAVDAQAGKYWKREGWWKLPATAKKVAITEFTVEFVTAVGTQSEGLGIVPIMQMAGVGKKQYQYDEAMMQTLPTELYDLYVQELSKAGFEVVPAQAVREAPSYQKVKLSEEGDKTKSSSTSGHGWRHHHTQRGELYSAHGLVAADDSWFASGKNAINTLNAIGEVGADTGLRVRMKVGLDDKGRATFWPGATVYAFGDVKLSKWSTPEKPAYEFKVSGVMTSKQMLYFSEPVVDSKEFQAFKGDVFHVQGAPFATAVRGVFPQFASLCVYALR
jgi:hypothetical protein